MNSGKRVIRALKHDNPARAPRELWMMPGIPMFRSKEILQVQSRGMGRETVQSYLRAIRVVRSRISL